MENAPSIRLEVLRSFLGEYKRPTGRLRTKSRLRVLEQILERHRLSLGETIEAIRQLAPKSDPTGPRKEIRLEALFLSVPAEDLPRLRFSLDYDGDYKDVEEYLFHDIDDGARRARILEHLAGRAGGESLKVLTDVDDTLYANLVESRYPKKTLYPGVLEMYEAVGREPGGVGVPAGRIPITTLSARPNPVGGILEEGSIASLTHLSGDRLLPVALSGRSVSSAIGTLETLGRKLASRRLVGDLDRVERRIGEVKYQNFRRYAAVYPDYRFVFFGDSGQADALTADLMLEDPKLRDRVVATFIHDLRSGTDDHVAASPSFLEVESDRPPKLLISRNYIDAAVQAYRELDGRLVSAGGLAAVTEAALDQFASLGLGDGALAEQYAEDARRALAALEEEPSTAEAATRIRRRLDRFR